MNTTSTPVQVAEHPQKFTPGDGGQPPRDHKLPKTRVLAARIPRELANEYESHCHRSGVKLSNHLSSMVRDYMRSHGNV